MSEPHFWRPRWYRVVATLGAGRDAARLETSIEGEEYVGPFGSLGLDAQRRQRVVDGITAALEARFRGEQVRVVRYRPIAHPSRRRDGG